MYLLVAFVFFIYFSVKISNLRMEINNLRKDLQSRSAESVASAPAIQSVATSAPIGVPVQAQVISPEEPGSADRFIKWFSENWLLKVGVLMVLVGFGWFVSYAFIHNWIGPVGKVMFGFLTGGALALWGAMRLTKDAVQGTMLLVLGSALVVITAIAGESIYEFYSEFFSLGIVFLVAVYVAFVGATQNKRNIAIYAVLIGLFAPLMTHGDNMSEEVLFSYLAVVSVSTIWVAFMKNWRIVNAIALTGVLAYSLPYITDGSLDNYFVLFMIYVLAIKYFVVSILGIVRSDKEVASEDAYVAIMNSVLILGATVSIVPEELRSLTLAAWMLVFGMGSFIVFTKTHKEKFFYIYSLIAVTFLSIATSIELDNQDVIFAFAFEATAVSIASYIVTRKQSVGYAMSILMAVPVLMALPSFVSSAWDRGVLHKDFAIIVAVGTLLVLLGIYYYMSRNENGPEDPELPKAYTAHLIVGSSFFFGLLWVALHAGLDSSSSAVTISLMVYTIIGLVAYFYGMRVGSQPVKYYGSVLVILVIARLVLVDAWAMSLGPRVVMFVLIGVLLMSTAWVTKKRDTTPTITPTV